MLEYLYSLIGPFEIEAFVRIVLAAILAGIIGYERQAWKKPAGFRTHILVCESAVLVMLCGIYLKDNIGGTDPRKTSCTTDYWYGIYWSWNNFKGWLPC